MMDRIPSPRSTPLSTLRVALRRAVLARARARRARIIHVIFQFLAGLEVGDFLGRHFHLGPGLGIAARASAPLPRAKTAEAADFDFIVRLQRGDYAFEN